MANKGGCSGCFGVLIVVAGIIQLIISIFTLNLWLFVWSILSTLVLGLFIGDRLLKADKRKAEQQIKIPDVLMDEKGEYYDW